MKTTFKQYFEALPKYADKEKVKSIEGTDDFSFNQIREALVKKYRSKLYDILARSKNQARNEKIKEILDYDAIEIGVGSARAVIPGSKANTIIKFAMNTEGLKQNLDEVSYYNYNLSQEFAHYFPKLIDYDKESLINKIEKHPLWIEFQKAEPVDSSVLKDQLGISMKDFEKYFDIILDIVESDKKENEVDINSYYKDADVNEFKDMLKLFKFLKRSGRSIYEFTSIENWGIIDRQLVIIDLGM